MFIDQFWHVNMLLSSHLLIILRPTSFVLNEALNSRLPSVTWTSLDSAIVSPMLLASQDGMSYHGEMGTLLHTRSSRPALMLTLSRSAFDLVLLFIIDKNWRWCCKLRFLCALYYLRILE